MSVHGSAAAGSIIQSNNSNNTKYYYDLKTYKYLRSHKIYSLFETLLSSLVLSRPENPKEFLVEQLRNIPFPRVLDDEEIDLNQGPWIVDAEEEVNFAANDLTLSPSFSSYASSQVDIAALKGAPIPKEGAEHVHGEKTNAVPSSNEAPTTKIDSDDTVDDATVDDATDDATVDDATVDDATVDDATPSQQIDRGSTIDPLPIDIFPKIDPVLADLSYEESDARSVAPGDAIARNAAREYGKEPASAGADEQWEEDRKRTQTSANGTKRFSPLTDPSTSHDSSSETIDDAHTRDPTTSKTESNSINNAKQKPASSAKNTGALSKSGKIGNRKTDDIVKVDDGIDERGNSEGSYERKKSPSKLSRTLSAKQDSARKSASRSLTSSLPSLNPTNDPAPRETLTEGETNTPAKSKKPSKKPSSPATPLRKTSASPQRKEHSAAPHKEISPSHESAADQEEDRNEEPRKLTKKTKAKRGSSNNLRYSDTVPGDADDEGPVEAQRNSKSLSQSGGDTSILPQTDDSIARSSGSVGDRMLKSAIRKSAGDDTLPKIRSIKKTTSFKLENDLMPLKSDTNQSANPTQSQQPQPQPRPQPQFMLLNKINLQQRAQQRSSLQSSLQPTQTNSQATPPTAANPTNFQHSSSQSQNSPNSSPTQHSPPVNHFVTNQHPTNQSTSQPTTHLTQPASQFVSQIAHQSQSPSQHPNSPQNQLPNQFAIQNLPLPTQLNSHILTQALQHSHTLSTIPPNTSSQQLALANQPLMDTFHQPSDSVYRNSGSLSSSQTFVPQNTLQDLHVSQQYPAHHPQYSSATQFSPFVQASSQSTLPPIRPQSALLRALPTPSEGQYPSPLYFENPQPYSIRPQSQPLDPHIQLQTLQHQLRQSQTQIDNIQNQLHDSQSHLIQLQQQLHYPENTDSPQIQNMRQNSQTPQQPIRTSQISLHPVQQEPNLLKISASNMRPSTTPVRPLHSSGLESQYLYSSTHSVPHYDFTSSQNIQNLDSSSTTPPDALHASTLQFSDSQFLYDPQYLYYPTSPSQLQNQQPMSQDDLSEFTRSESQEYSMDNSSSFEMAYALDGLEASPQSPQSPPSRTPSFSGVHYQTAHLPSAHSRKKMLTVPTAVHLNTHTNCSHAHHSHSSKLRKSQSR